MQRNPNEWAGLLKWSLKYHDNTQQSDLPPMSEERKRWLAEALEQQQVINPSERMSELVDWLMVQEQANDGRSDIVSQGVEELMDLVDQVDCACDVGAMGKLPSLVKLLKSPKPAYRAIGAEVLGIVVQNNPKMQKQAMDASVLEFVTHLCANDQDAAVKKKSLLCLSCLVRNNSDGNQRFVHEGDGVLMLAEMVQQCTQLGQADIGTLRKALTLVKYLITSDSSNKTHQLVITSSLPQSCLSLLGMSECDWGVAEVCVGVLGDLAKHQPCVVRLCELGLAQTLTDLINRINAMSGDDQQEYSDVCTMSHDLVSFLSYPPPTTTTNTPATGTTTTTATGTTTTAIGTTTTTTPTQEPRKSNSSAKRDVFVATNEWQEVREGQAIPPGLHVKFDLATGKNFAKILTDDPVDPNLTPTTSSVVVHRDHTQSLTLTPE